MVSGADKVTYVSLEEAEHGGAQFAAELSLQLEVNFLDKYSR